MYEDPHVKSGPIIGGRHAAGTVGEVQLVLRNAAALLKDDFFALRGAAEIDGGRAGDAVDATIGRVLYGNCVFGRGDVEPVQGMSEARRWRR